MAYNGLSQHVNFEELPAPGDRFILQDLIGEGTYGEVYSARDTVSGKTSSHTRVYPKSFRTARLEREPQMVQLSATR
jgi:myosin-3